MIKLDVVRRDFPILARKINRKQLAYLDNAATSQKPTAVLDMLTHYYTKHNANVHRGIHTLSVEATEEYELARKVVGNFVGIKDLGEIIFVKNATEALNLIAYSWGRVNISKNDEIVVTVAEHHSNFVVWQQLALDAGAILKVVPVDDEGEVDLVAFKKAITMKTKLVSFFHVSNVLGTINDVKRLSTIVHRLSKKAVVVVDGAQAVPHMKVDISKIGCDFYVFTG
ncbi:MAG: aminotransferase class V-fold PLP-dependent enzyme, partial [Candidatus Curtissbacteria bacterium]